MIGRLADCVITDLLLTELSFGASTMSTGCDCSTTPIPKTARFLEIGVFASARAPGLRLVGKLG